MPAPPTASVTNEQNDDPAARPAAPRTVRTRAAALLSSAVAALLGVAPHVLHHAGPLAGAALVAGTAGTLLFGAIGLAASVPLLLRVHRRCGNWRIPAGLLALFTIVFSISAFVIGPAISGSNSTTTTEPTRGTPNGKPAPSNPPARGPKKEGHERHH